MVLQSNFFKLLNFFACVPNTITPFIDNSNDGYQISIYKFHLTLCLYLIEPNCINE